MHTSLVWFLLLAAAPKAGPGGFQQVKWGTTKADVVAAYGGLKVEFPAEPRVRDEGEDLALNEVKIGDATFLGELLFVDGRLVEAKAFNAWGGTGGDALAMFTQLRASLSEKYGKPIEKNRGSPGTDRSAALLRGSLKLTSTWKTSDTLIALSVYGDGEQTEVMLTYAQPDAERLLKARAAAKQNASVSAAKKDL